MNFSRKMIFVVGAALLAACGDKVTVAAPTPPTPAVLKINSVDVAPLSATITAGQSITFTAAVNADAGVTYTTAWSSSVSSITVSSAGVVTTTAASVTPGAAICAEATAGTQKVKGCATLVVQATPAVLPASVSINSIRSNVLGTTVNPSNVAGVIDITLNVNPGNQTVSKIVLLVGGVRADSQTFTAAQAAALRFASDEAVAAQATFPQILFSVNTAKWAANGTPFWLNGAQGISAQLYTTQAGTASAATASAQTTLTFNNVDGFLATMVTSGTTANALNASGFRYDRGGLDVTVTPVIYSGRAISTATVFFGSAACDASAAATGTRNTALVAPVTGSTAWTKSWPAATPSGSSQANFLTNYEFGAATSVGCTALNPTGETIAVTAVDAGGDAILALAAPLNVTSANSIRLDNNAPRAGSPAFMANPNVRQNGWINGGVLLNGSSSAMSATSNNWLFSAPTILVGLATTRDFGQGTYTRYVRIANNTGGTVDDARAATASSAAVLPAPSAANNTYCAIATAQDALGNETARPAAATLCNAPVVASNAAANTGLNHQSFGVDIAAPTITQLSSTDLGGSLDANERRNGANITNNFNVQVSDTGTVGNSGMLSGGSVLGTVIVRNDAAAPAITAAARCAVGVIDANDGVTCLSASVNAAPAFPVVSVLPIAGNSNGVGVTAITGATTPGYYTYTAVSRDAAGNSSAAVSKTISFDVTANVPALTSALFSVPLTGPSATFNANASDNFDLRDALYTLTYGGGLVGPLVYPRVTLGTFFPTAQSYSNVPAGITIPNFVRQVENITANAAITVGGAFKPMTLTGTVRDQANLSSAPAVTAIPGASVTTGVSYLAAAAPLLARSFAISNAAAAISDGQGPLAAVNPTSVTLNADVTGPTATFNPPFARVDFYIVVGANLVQIGTTTAISTVDDGSAFGRRHRYSITWAPGATALGAASIYAVGVNAVGDALVTMVNVNITVTNP